MFVVVSVCCCFTVLVSVIIIVIVVIIVVVIIIVVVVLRFIAVWIVMLLSGIGSFMRTAIAACWITTSFVASVSIKRTESI